MGAESRGFEKRAARQKLSVFTLGPSHGLILSNAVVLEVLVIPRRAERHALPFGGVSNSNFPSLPIRSISLSSYEQSVVLVLAAEYSIGMRETFRHQSLGFRGSRTKFFHDISTIFPPRFPRYLPPPGGALSPRFTNSCEF